MLSYFFQNLNDDLDVYLWGGGRLGLSKEADLSALQLVRAELNELRLMRSNIGILGRSILRRN